MDYIRELNALYHFMLRNKLPKSEFALLTALYMINNAEDWVLWFEADNELLGRLTGGYSREAINTARNGLKQRGRIEFCPGKRNAESAKYHIIPLARPGKEPGMKHCKELDKELDMKLDVKLDMELDKELDVKLDHNTKHKQDLDLNKDTPPISPAKAFEAFFGAYPNPVMRQKAWDAFMDTLAGGYQAEDLVAAAQNYAEYARLTGEKMYHPGNFLGNYVFVEFLPGKYKRPQGSSLAWGGNSSRFGRFPQNSYDFDALEKDFQANN